MSKPNLYDRFIKFLIAVHKSKPGIWVFRNTLKDLAFKNNYRKQTVWNAFEALDNDVRIGKKSDEGTKYIYYDMPEEEIKERQALIDWFDNYPKASKTK